MKKIYPFLSLLVIILAYPLISLLMVLIIGNLVQSPTLRPHPITLLSLIIYFIIQKEHSVSPVFQHQNFHKNNYFNFYLKYIRAYSYRIYRFYFQRHIINKKRIFYVSKIDIWLGFNSCFRRAKLQNYYYQ